MKCPVCRATYRSSASRSQKPEARGQRTEGRGQEARSIPLLEQELEAPREVTLPPPSSLPPSPPSTLNSQLSTLNSSPSPRFCHRCGVDLAPLIHLHDQAIWYHRQAIEAFKAGDYETAIAQTNQAIALNPNQADFHALAGQLWALQGEFKRAVAAWKKAQKLDPKHSTASAFLQWLMRF